MQRKLINLLLSLEKFEYAFNRQYNVGSFETYTDFLLDVF